MRHYREENEVELYCQNCYDETQSSRLYAYSIDITRQVLDPRFIISYAILRADMGKGITSAAPTPALVI